MWCSRSFLCYVQLDSRAIVERRVDRNGAGSRPTVLAKVACRLLQIELAFSIFLIVRCAFLAVVVDR
jgi:hypothetical protein